MKDVNLLMDMSFGAFVKDISSDGKIFEDSHSIEMCWHEFQPYYPAIKEYYPIYLGWQNENKTEKAFKIVNILIKQKIIKLNKVKDFVELVNDIAKEI